MENFINNAPFIVVLLCLIVGFVFLVKGADLFVEGSSSVAKRFKVPSLIIGLTIVAMGTSLPETAVSVAASIAHNNTLAVSNVTGSNIFNLMVVIGVCALMTPIVVDGASLKKGFPIFDDMCHFTSCHGNNRHDTRQSGRDNTARLLCRIYFLPYQTHIKTEQAVIR